VQPLLGQVHETAMIREDSEFPMLQIQTPLIHSYQYGQIFFLVSQEAPSMRTQSLADKGKRVPLLQKHNTHSIVTSVGLDLKWLCKIKQHEDRS
jgi:hypothetical protein